MLEKIFGTLIGVAVLIFAISAKSTFMIWQASSFIVLNLILGYEVFQSFGDIFEQSDFAAVLNKWVILAIVSCVVAGVGMLIFH